MRAQVDPQDPRRPFAVETPHFRIVVVGTRFDVLVECDASSVSVLEGRVRVERNGVEVLLGAGESIRSDDYRFGQALPPSPQPRPKVEKARSSRLPSTRVCAREPELESRMHCLERLAAGGGMAAESALYMLGLLARDARAEPRTAIDYWLRHKRRFPAGALAPEAAFAVFETLLTDGSAEEILEASADFERRFPSDPRVAEVMLARVRLLCADPGRLHEGRALLETLQARAPPSLTDRLARVEALCQESEASPAGQARPP
jgi:hypothetical protein